MNPPGFHKTISSCHSLPALHKSVMHAARIKHTLSSSFVYSLDVATIYKNMSLQATVGTLSGSSTHDSSGIAYGPL